MFMLFHGVVAATFVLVVAYFVLVASTKASGFVGLLGKLLALWLAFIAAVFVAGVVTASMNGGKPFGMDLPHPPHGPWMREAPLPAPPPAPASAAPSDTPAPPSN